MQPEHTALVFPGQGSQSVGMASSFMDFATTRELFREADDTLGFPLSDLMRSGPVEELNKTINAQPALLLAGYAAALALEEVAERPVTELVSWLAGHSLGEYTALTVAGCWNLPTALKLVRRRGEAMQNAVPNGSGAMAAILGLDMTDMDSICRTAGCWVANDNCDGQVVISGANSTVDEASNMAAMQGARKIMRLEVSAPSHCPLMQPAADSISEALDIVEIKAPALPVVLNTTAKAETNTATIQAALVRQLTDRVRWRESMVWLAEQGATQIWEAGNGKVLTGLAKRCDARLSGTPLSTLEDVQALAQNLNKAQEGAA